MLCPFHLVNNILKCKLFAPIYLLSFCIPCIPYVPFYIFIGTHIHIYLYVYRLSLFIYFLFTLYIVCLSICTICPNIYVVSWYEQSCKFRLKIQFKNVGSKSGTIQMKVLPSDKCKALSHLNNDAGVAKLDNNLST